MAKKQAMTLNCKITLIYIGWPSSLYNIPNTGVYSTGNADPYFSRTPAPK